jgi:hypothetical protein
VRCGGWVQDNARVLRSIGVQLLLVVHPQVPIAVTDSVVVDLVALLIRTRELTNWSRCLGDTFPLCFPCLRRWSLLTNDSRRVRHASAKGEVSGILALKRLRVTNDSLVGAGARLTKQAHRFAAREEVHPSVGLRSSRQQTIREHTFGETLVIGIWGMSISPLTLPFEVLDFCERVLVRQDALAAID